MKLTSVKNKIAPHIALPGLITGGIRYEIKSGESDLSWTGPKISPELWSMVLAFFRDTYNRTKAECQVRLYVNTITSQWTAWAYPQEAAHSMAIKELPDHPRMAEERAQFKLSEGWHYFGTAHHHCSGTAFQSGTDRHGTGGMGEVQQDGLHLTVGKMDHATQYDIHARFYLDGAEFEPDLSLFWDIGADAAKLVPDTCYNLIARHQMTQAPALDMAYPEQWKENIIEVKTTIGFGTHGFFGLGRAESNGRPDCAPNGQTGSNQTTTSNAPYWDGVPEVRRKENALTMARRAVMADPEATVTPEALDNLMLVLSTHPIIDHIREAAIQHRVSIMDIVDEWEWDRDMKQHAEAYGWGGGME